MRRTPPLWIGFGLALCCLLLVVILTSPHGQVAAAPLQTTPTPVRPLSSGPGIPAIRPSISPSLAAASASTARFTTADVQAYLKNHPFIGGKLVKGATGGVASIQFLTSAQASTLMKGADTGLPATATVCYVKMQGPFTIIAPLAPGAKQLPPAAYGVEIFDGQTGNMLMWWVP